MTASNETSALTVTASASQRRACYAAIGASILVLAALVPFAKVQLPAQAAFIPSYQSALVVADLMTAVVLFGQFHALRSRALFVLASGYLFTAFVAVMHMLTYPGVFAPTGLFGARPQTTAWMYMAWHAGFPLFVIVYARLKEKEDAGEARTVSSSATAMFAAFGATFALAGASLLAATAGHDALPPIMSGSRYTPAMVAVVSAVWLCSFIAFVALAMKPRRTALDLWLMVVMAAWMCDIALSAMLNAGRYDLGFYAGRVYGLAAGALVLVALLVEHGRLLGSLARASAHEAEERARLTAMNAGIQEAREAAVAADRAKDVFLATMSHEIRTPMNGVLGLLELLSLSDLEASQRAQVDTIRESAQSLMRIIDDLLDFSKIEAGRLEIFPEATSIARVVALAAEGFRGAASSKKLILASHVDDRISPAVWVDGLRLRQILNNLVSNAIKFTENGKVSIGAFLVAREDRQDVVRIDVHDTGIGIAPDDQGKLFQPFTQAAASTTRKYGGTGLGLSICRRLAQMMGGEIQLRSEPGRGTTVSLTLRMDRVELPPEALAPPAVAAPASRALPEAVPREGFLVLAADDHPINLLVLQRQLTRIGYASESAQDGREALELWRTGRFSLIVTDCHMPELDGYQLARAIREEEAQRGLPRVPIIAFTANAMAGEAEQCHAAGMDDYIAKPVQIAALAAKLNAWLPQSAVTG